MITLTTYSLQVLAPSTADVEGELRERVNRLRESDIRLLANLPAYVESWQEDMSDLLPEGYSVVLKEWSE